MRPAWLVLLVAVGCGGEVVEPTLTCEPACPAHLRCTEQGCVPDGDAGAPDLAVALSNGHR